MKLVIKQVISELGLQSGVHLPQGTARAYQGDGGCEQIAGLRQKELLESTQRPELKPSMKLAAKSQQSDLGLNQGPLCFERGGGRKQASTQLHTMAF